MIYNSYKPFLYSIGLMAILILAGCARYQAQPLRRLIPMASPHIKERSIRFAYHIFSKYDCKVYLDRNVIAKGYQPIQITIVNNSDQAYCLSTKGFSLPCAATEDVALQVHTSTGKRVAGYGLGSIFLFPLIIPAVVDGIKSSEANQQLDSDFANKHLCEQIVEPYNVVNGLVFVPTRSYQKEFNITLTEAQTGKPITLSTQKPKVILGN